MALTGRELVEVTPVTASGIPTSVDQLVTTQAIANLGGGGSGITVGTTTITSGTTTRILYDNVGVVGEYTLTGTGTVVAMATSPSLVTPILGTPTSGTLTNCTIPVGGVSGLGTGVATFLATPSSANLATAVTGETGTGALVFGTAPTFSGQITTQDVTTTSPGFYSQITGDTVPRVRVGINANDVASIGFGSGAGTRDLFLERAGAANLRHGGADSATPVAQTVSVQNVVTGTTNTAGSALTIAGSVGTGTGVGGSIILQVAPAGSTGTTQNALATALTIDSTKLATFAAGASLGGTMVPTSSDGAALGTTALQWSDVFLAAGGVINWSNGNVTLTHTTNTLTFAGNNVLITVPAALTFSWTTRTKLSSNADGSLLLQNAAANSFSLLLFGGTTSSFPAIKRSTTSLQARLADDSAFTVIQGKLTTDTNATTGLTAGVLSATTNASIVVYDASGQAYRIPCII